MKKMISRLLPALLLLAALLLSACSGEPCTSHSDGNGDGICDNCSSPVPATDAESTEAPDAESTEAPDAGVECTLSVLLDNGTPAAGVAFTLIGEDTEKALTSGADGCVAATLAVGTYTVAFDYDTLPDGCIPDTVSVTVSAEADELLLTLIDNTPDGSAAKPFFITADITSLSVTAGGELFYTYRGAAERQIRIDSSDLTVTYKGVTYSAVDGTVTVTLAPTIGEITVFSVKNTSAQTVESTMALVSPLGSMENPIPVTESAFTVNVPAGAAVYYRLTAETSGVLLATSRSEVNNISLINTVTNAVSAMTAGSAGEYLAVSAGDEIVISVATVKADTSATVDVTLHCYAATVEDPVPAVKKTVDLSFPANASLTFSAPAGKTVRITDDGVSVTVGETEYTPDESGNVSITLAGDGDTVSVTVKNTKDTTNGITVIIE